MDRQRTLDRLKTEDPFDLIIIGGGASGLGAAFEATTRNYKVLVVEKNDFAQGTSSRSTKLIHGGVRYLRQGEISLVQSALKEREYLLNHAPHIVKPLPFIIPIHSWWDRFFYGIGLKLYDWLAGSKKLGKTTFLPREEALGVIPNLAHKKLIGGICYYDAQFDDTRLAINLAQTIFKKGGNLANYMSVQSFLKNKENLLGVKLKDELTGEEFEAFGHGVINATGVFADSVRQMDHTSAKPMLKASQGIHIVLSKDFLKSDHAIMLPKTNDGRVLFAIPWHNRVLYGTTDTPQNISEEPTALEAEIDYLIEHGSQIFETPPKRGDILSVFAGLRPLVQEKETNNTASISRDHTIEVSPSGLITIMGGKWTTWRKMGFDVINEAERVTGFAHRFSYSIETEIHNYQKTPADSPLHFYGMDAGKIEKFSNEHGFSLEMLHPDFVLSEAQIRWAVRFEMAKTIEDILARRTRILFLDAQVAIDLAPKVAEIMADELGKNEDWITIQVQRFNSLASKYLC